MLKKFLQIIFLSAAFLTAEYWQTPQWLNLLYYERSGNSYKSLAVNQDFFVSPRGASDPRAEYEASLALVRQDDFDFKKKFPLRYKYIARYNNLPYVPAVLTDTDFKRVYLAYPGRYMRDKISTFGHLFLVMDVREHLLGGRILHFWANTENEPEDLLFAYKGLAGKYTGHFMEEKYQIRFKSDSYVEDREVLFCDLNLSAEQLEDFQLHCLEIQDARFRYYFISDNCAFFLGKFLNVVVGQNIVNRHLYLLPAQVFNDYYAFDSEQPVLLRTSLVQEFNRVYNTLSAQQKKEVHSLLYTAGASSSDKLALRTFLLISEYFRAHHPDLTDTIRGNRTTAFRQLDELYSVVVKQEPEELKEQKNFSPINTRSFQLNWQDNASLEMQMTPICFTEYEKMNNLEISNIRVLTLGLQNDLRDAGLKLRIEPLSIENIVQTNTILPDFSWSAKSSFTYGDGWGADQEFYGGYSFNVLSNTGLLYVLAGANLTNYTDFTEDNFRALDLFGGAKIGYKKALGDNLDLRLAYEHKYTADRQSAELLYKKNNIVSKFGYTQTKIEGQYRLGVEILY